MRNIYLTLTTVIISLISSGDSLSTDIYNDSLNTIKPNRLSIYFGWNRAAYTKSDIRFFGSDYDFTIQNATSSDRQTPFKVKTYFGIQTLTIPQTNMGFSYQLSPKVSIALNVDHMKYILDQDQKANLNGTIGDQYPNWTGVYDNTSTKITEDLVRFEHTDGLNYVNLSYSRNHLIGRKKRTISFRTNYGGSIGFMLPKTNSRLLGKERYDDFHVSGYGIGIHTGIQADIGSIFFIKSNLKGGFINMPDIRTTLDKSDQASQHFMYAQINFLLGVNLDLSSIMNKAK